MKNKKFKPVYLYSDDYSIKRVTDRYNRGAEMLNKFVEKAENILSKNFDDDEKMKVREKGISFVINQVRERFLFKEATDEFNLQAIGIDLKPLQQFYAKNGGSWQGFQYDLSEGLFKANDAGLSKAVENFSYYTQNIAQNKALELAQELKANILKIEDAGYVDRFNKGDISNVTELLIYDFKGLNINYRFIRQLK